MTILSVLVGFSRFRCLVHRQFAAPPHEADGPNASVTYRNNLCTACRSSQAPLSWLLKKRQNLNTRKSRHAGMQWYSVLDSASTRLLQLRSIAPCISTKDHTFLLTLHRRPIFPRSPFSVRPHDFDQFLFISDVMESFSPPNPRGEESAAFADDQENPETTPAPSPGYSSAAPASRGSSFASRRCRSSFASSSPSGNNGIGGEVTDRIAPEPRFSKLPSSTTTGSSTAEPNTSWGLELESGGGNEGRRRSGEDGGKASRSRRRSATPPPRIDTGGLRTPANSSESPVGFAR